MKTFSTLKWRNLLRVNNYILLFILGILLSPLAEAQKTHKVYGIKGVSIINENISYKEAKAEALNDAKINALKKAGVIENINTYQVLMSTQENKDFSQYFSSGILTDLQGAISGYKIVKDFRQIRKNENELSVEVEIDAEVVSYETKSDPNFEVKLEGVRSIYDNNENLSFSVTPSMDCYLKVFSWEDGVANMIYPNKFDKNMVLKKDEKTVFPLGRIDYKMVTDGILDEKSKWVFIFTKSNLPFVNIDEELRTTTDNVLNWASLIAPDQKKVIYKSVLIQHNK